MMKTKVLAAISGLGIVLSLAGCGILAGGGNSAFTPIPPGDGNGIVQSEATVESIEVLTLESFPVQVSATVKGYVPNGCVEVGSPEVSQDGNTYTIVIPTSRMIDALCTEAIVSFEMNVPLDVLGAKAGTYAVVSGNTSTQFILSVDNVPAEGGAIPCVAGDGEAIYTKPDEGYCVAYPAAFEVDEQESGVTVIHGPDYSGGPEPQVGFVNISSQPALARTPAQVSDELVADFLNTDILPERSDTLLGGEPAVEIIGMPGQALSWQVVAVHGETLYWLVFSPLGEENGDAFTDMQTLYDMVMRSFQFTD